MSIPSLSFSIDLALSMSEYRQIKPLVEQFCNPYILGLRLSWILNVALGANAKGFCF